MFWTIILIGFLVNFFGVSPYLSRTNKSWRIDNAGDVGVILFLSVFWPFFWAYLFCNKIGMPWYKKLCRPRCST